MKKLFTLEILTTLLFILAITSMFAGVFAKSITLSIIGLFTTLIPLPIVILLDEN